MIDTLLSLLAPHSCCGCGTKGPILCEFCKNDITSEPFEGCVSCCMPCMSGNLCFTCANTIGASGVWCVALRRTALKQLLDAYKFDSAREAAGVAATLLDARLPVLPKDLVVTAAPTISANRRKRGFDHATLIARRFARSRGLSYSLLLRRVDNQTQHFKSRQDRLRFDAKSLDVQGKIPPRVLLIDDIYTTGATVRACVEKLRSAGAIEVYVAIIARQPLDARDDL